MPANEPVTPAHVVISIRESKSIAFGSPGFIGSRHVSDFTLAELVREMEASTSRSERRRFDYAIEATKERLDQWMRLMKSRGMEVPNNINAFEQQQIDASREDLGAAAHQAHTAIVEHPSSSKVRADSLESLLTENRILRTELRQSWKDAFPGLPFRDPGAEAMQARALENLAAALAVRDISTSLSTAYDFAAGRAHALHSAGDPQLSKRDMKRVISAYEAALDIARTELPPLPGGTALGNDAEMTIMEHYDLELDHVVAEAGAHVRGLRERLEPRWLGKTEIAALNAEVEELRTPEGLGRVTGRSEVVFDSDRVLSEAHAMSSVFEDMSNETALSDAITICTIALRRFAAQVKDNPAVAPFAKILNEEHSALVVDATLVAVEYIAHLYLERAFDSLDAVTPSLPPPAQGQSLEATR